MEHLKGFGSLFYMVNPYETMFEKVEDVPNPGYLATGFPYFFAMIVIEQIILKLQLGLHSVPQAPSTTVLTMNVLLIYTILVYILCLI